MKSKKNYLYRAGVIVLMALMMICLGACGSDNRSLLTGEPWYFYDEITSEHQVMSFGEDGSFSWNCECGEPIGDSGLYELYEFDSKNNLLIFYNEFDDSRMEVTLLEYNSEHLLMDFGNEIMDFQKLRMEPLSPVFEDLGREYLGEYQSFSIITQMGDDFITTGSLRYDPESDYDETAFSDYSLADDVEIYELTIYGSIIYEGDQIISEEYEKSWKRLSREELETVIENGCAASFLWFDRNLKVKKAVLFGETIASE